MRPVITAADTAYVRSEVVWLYSSKSKPDPRTLLRLLLLAGCFLAGTIFGQVFASRLSLSSTDEINRYLGGYFSLERKITGRTIGSAFFIYFRYPLLAFLLGFTPLGVILLPILSGLYGFFLSFSAGSFAAAYGVQGVLLALVVFGVRCAVTLPCYLTLAVPALASSISRLPPGQGRRSTPMSYPPDTWRTLFTTVLILLAGVWEELFLAPRLLDCILLQILGGA